MGQRAYLENQVMNATQDKLLIMLYEGAINFLKRIDSIDFDKDIEIRNTNIKKAIAIITELQCTLNMDYEEISGPLFMLYDYMRNRLLEANMHKKKEYIDEVAEMLGGLKSSFIQASAPITDVEQSNDYSSEEETAETSVYEAISFSG